jgi:KamA family protein
MKQTFFTRARERKDKLKYVCTVEELRRHIELDAEEADRVEKIAAIHPMRITEYYLSLIDTTDKIDPIRKMAVPWVEEFDESGDYDTSGESENTKIPGLQHKYERTALVLVTSECATYCRFCFRKRLVGLPNREVVQDFGECVRYIRSHPEINNVLISGGDPLTLSTSKIKAILDDLSDIPHIEFIRIGTRVPVTCPDRILGDEALLNLLNRHSVQRRRLYVVAHFNHPREITEKSAGAVESLLKSKVVVNNQTVLLKGVNDNPNTLANLQNRLAGIGVTPYYVFQCRPVKRVKRHFQVPLQEGYEIVESAKKLLAGPAKRFRYVMSHKTGKIEIVGVMGDAIYLRYHQAKDPRNAGRFFRRKLDGTAAWLDELEQFTYADLPLFSMQDFLEGRPSVWGLSERD